MNVPTPSSTSAVAKACLLAAWLGVAGITVGCGPKTGGTLPAPTAPRTEGILGAGDIFEIRVYGEPELSGTYRVSPDGSIDFPLVGRMQVAELTGDVLSEKLTSDLKRFVRAPSVSVYVKEYNSQKVFVFGEVNTPGTFKFEKGMNIVQAITMAGGFAGLADKNGTYVTRNVDGKDQRIRVSVVDIGEGTVPNLKLAPGDIIYVPEAIF